MIDLYSVSRHFMVQGVRKNWSIKQMAKKTAAPPENVDLYINLMTSVPGIEVKGATMPYTSLNGNMFSFLKEGAVALRLAEHDREVFLKKFKSSLFETIGTVMKEYVTISQALLKKPKDLKPYILLSYAYAKKLKSKASTGSATASAGTTKRKK